MKNTDIETPINVLLLGGGGREHALAWKLAQSPRLGILFAAPGNPGIASLATIVPLEIEDHAAVADFCRREAIGLVVVGPEAPLVAGIADGLRAEGIAVFGPSAAAARLEGSKGFTKDLCAEYGIATAGYARFSNAEAARAHVSARGAPIVVKADGLAAGKGVTVATDVASALAAIDDCLSQEGAEVVVEEFLEGEEASLFCLCDGTSAMFFGTAQDHKRAFDGDEGPNTGGMGAYGPAPVMSEEIIRRAMDDIVAPTLKGMAARGTPFSGVLYVGLMIDGEGPKLIEYNVRFGDPECQVLMMRLKSDLLPILAACALGDLSGTEPEWHDNAALCVVVANRGYPGAFARGTSIRALPVDTAETVVFHAGTRRVGPQLIAEGGRVLGVTGTGGSVGQAAARAYHALGGLDWPDGFWRTDIGRRAIERERRPRQPLA